jgi:cytochrome c oxidase subunit 1
MLYLPGSLKWGRKVGNNPWEAKGLEWQIESPPITHNFHGPVTVTEEAYAYGDEPAHGAGHVPPSTHGHKEATSVR